MEPPYTPFDKYGIYWSDRFLVSQGDIITLKVRSEDPLSWFGVDWSSLDIRGLLATTELDEDGRSFNPQYPIQSSVQTGGGGHILTVVYAVQDDTQCVVVVKNANPHKPCELSLEVTLRSPFTIMRFLKGLPVIGALMKHDDANWH